MSIWLRSLLVALVITVVTGTMYHFNSFYNVETNYYDRLTKEFRPVDSRIVIIGVDDYSLENIGRWPWPRDIHATLIERLHQAEAKAIGVDMMFLEAAPNREEDEAMQQAVAGKPNVIIPSAVVFFERQEEANQLVYKEIRAPIYQLSDEQNAHINVLADRGEIVRQIFLGLQTEDGKMLPAFSVRLANLFLPPEKQIVYQDGKWRQGERILFANERNQISFSFARPPGDRAPLSYFDVLNMDDETLHEYFQDKLVLIGPTSIGLGDQYVTSASNTTRMFGVEIHANMVQALQDGRFYQMIEGRTAWVGWLILFLLSFSLYDIAQRLSTLRALVVFFGYIVGYTFLVAQVNWSFHTILPYTYPMLAIVSSYVWSIVSQYVAEWREKNRITHLFGRYVSHSVVNEILHSDTAQNLGGTRKNVTLLFVDIRGFTPLSERIEPEEVIQVLNEYLDLCTKAIFTFEGTLDKFIGDGVMAIFGAPIPLPNHPERAVRAALEMKKGSAELAKRLTEKYGYSVSFGIGINSGDAVIGNIGSQNRLDYTAIGDTVNMAARLESNAKPGQILISEATYQQVKELFAIMPLGEINVKGKEKPVPVYQVLGEMNEKGVEEVV